MANITNCTFCGKCYEETSEEAANHPGRMCRECSERILTHVKAHHTPRCPICAGTNCKNPHDGRY